MDHAEDGDGIHQHVQLAPLAPAQPLDHALGGGDGQRYEHQNGQDADGDIVALDDILHKGIQIELQVNDDVTREMQDRIEKRIEADHPAVGDEFPFLQDFTGWPHREGQDDKDQRPVAQLPVQLLHRVRRQIEGAQRGVRPEGEDQPSQRYKTRDKNQRLEDQPRPFNSHGPRSTCLSPCLYTGPRLPLHSR